MNKYIGACTSALQIYRHANTEQQNFPKGRQVSRATNCKRCHKHRAVEWPKAGQVRLNVTYGFFPGWSLGTRLLCTHIQKMETTITGKILSMEDK